MKLPTPASRLPRSSATIAVALLLLVLATACTGATAADVAAPQESAAALDPLATTPALPAEPADDTPTTPPSQEQEYEGPGTDVVPGTPPQEYEGPGTDVVPGTPPQEYEGPGTEVVPQPGGQVDPVYTTTTPTTYRVTGVSPGDVLNVRSGPGADQPKIATFAADAIDINSTGQLATVGETDWFEVDVPGGTVGWVSSRFVEVQTREG